MRRSNRQSSQPPKREIAWLNRYFDLRASYRGSKDWEWIRLQLVATHPNLTSKAKTYEYFA